MPIILALLVFAGGSQMIDASAVNLREKANMDASVKFRLPYGTRCEVLERVKGSWLHISLAHDPPISGFVRANFVTDVRFKSDATDRRWMDLARNPKKGLKRPVVIDDLPCQSLDEACVEDYRKRYYIERRNSLERWIYWDEDVPMETRSELWSILGGPYTPYMNTPADILNQSPFFGLPRAIYTGARDSYKVDIHGPRGRGLECSPMPATKASFFIEVPERFAVSRGTAHGGLVDFSGGSGKDELTKVLNVYFRDENPFEFRTADRYESTELVPFVLLDLKTRELERNAGRPVFIPSRNMFLLSDLDKERPDKREVLVFFSWIEVYLKQIMETKKVTEVRPRLPKTPGNCARVSHGLHAFDFNKDKIPDVFTVKGELAGDCGYRRQDTYLNLDGKWIGFVNTFETWCDNR